MVTQSILAPNILRNVNTFLGIEDHVLIYLSFLTTGFLVHIFYNDILHYSQLAHFFPPLTLCASSHFVCLFIIARLTSSTYAKVCEPYLTKNEEVTHKTDHQQGYTE